MSNIASATATASAVDPLLKIENLTAYFNIGNNENIGNNTANMKLALENIHFEMKEGETTCLLGNSGSGKSLTAFSILQLLPDYVVYSKQSQILFQGQDLLDLKLRNLQSIRGGKIAMVFQEPMTSFNPVMTIGEQIKEMIRLHRKQHGKALLNETLSLLERVRLPEPMRVYNSYPHQLSGGMKQRAMIAMALAGQPKLLILDEPTTALDVTIQAQILDLLLTLQQELGMSMLFITHDIKVAEKMSNEIVVLQNGSQVESGKTEQVLHFPKEAFTQQLLQAESHEKISSIAEDAPIILKVNRLNVHFPIKGGIFRRTQGWVKAVSDLSLELRAGETLAVVGESGSGKTTLAKAIACLVPITSGEVFIDQSNISPGNLTKISPRDTKMRRQYQMIFQDPFSAMDPRFHVKDILEEGMIALGVEPDPQKRLHRMDELLEQVGLKSEHKYRYPHEFSGGERQRICIARALSVSPKIIICDEPTSSLDRSVQAQIIDLLISLQKEFGLSYLFITHNFEVVKAMAHRIAVMQSGFIIETGTVSAVMSGPHHPYTSTLLSAIL